MGGLGESTEKAWVSEPIAIVGMSSRFAGEATNTENLWSIIPQGRSGWTPFPASRFRAKGTYHPNNEKLDTVRPPLPLQSCESRTQLIHRADSRQRSTLFARGRHSV